jgi:putative gypsy type transposon
MANNNFAANIETNSVNPIFPPLVVCNQVVNIDVDQRDSDDSSDIKITPHYESIKTGETSVSPIFILDKYQSAPWEVSIAFLPNYLPRINPDLKGLLIVDMEKMEGLGGSSSRESTVQHPPPFYIEDGGHLNYFIDLVTKGELEKQRDKISTKFGLEDDYNLQTPRNYDTIRFPPPHCIVVYLPAFEQGLRFPLHPFCREVLDLLNVSVPELYPNTWGCIVAFLILCKVLGLQPLGIYLGHNYAIHKSMVVDGSHLRIVMD